MSSTRRSRTKVSNNWTQRSGISTTTKRAICRICRPRPNPMSLTLLDHPHLIAFTGDASVDFTTQDFDAPLAPAQSAYLKTHTGIDIPRVFWRKQVHGDDVLIAGKEACARGCPDADAFITDRKNVPIAIRTADCVPVFIYDPLRRVIGLVHAGWKGTRQRIAAKTGTQSAVRMAM